MGKISEAFYLRDYQERFGGMDTKDIKLLSAAASLGKTPPIPVVLSDPGM